MVGEEERGCGSYNPRLPDDEAELRASSGLDSLVKSLELMAGDHCQAIGEMDDSQFVGAPVTLAEGRDGCGSLPVEKRMAQVDVKVEIAENSLGKRRRGRPPRGQAKTVPPPRKKREEEDVCFICFDGGSLVLCDRRGCPKAYHPACIKRDEAFFRSKAKWNCGWHICVSCQKASHYMCYTCTYSLCKGCTKDADYVCVRGTKGFCGTCMRTIMLIENCSPGNNEVPQVDFDDKTSWEYLFKVYWIFLKEKLSLTVDELKRAKNPWRGDAIVHKGGSLGHLCNGANGGGPGSGNSCRGQGPERKNAKSRQNFPNMVDPVVTEISGDIKGTSLPEGAKWATTELLEFVAHMKNGDTSMLSQFDVQALLLEYIKRNNLRDPRQKCQIVSDFRLLKLFGKQRVGHLEMLKLLESHFYVKENPSENNAIGIGVEYVTVNRAEAVDRYDYKPKIESDGRRKSRRRVDEARQKANPEDYAAIDVHNIGMIYLRRNLIEQLINDGEKFHDKVVGSIVRIRISSTDEKHEMHRLVQVIGTSKTAEPYSIGEKTVDVMLHVLNLDKKEEISIESISNQECTEDDCRRLRQSIKLGLTKRFTVGEIREKAKALHVVKVTEWLEAEILRLSHLRDRASEKGHRKELRECVKKLQLLNSSEERQRRLHEIPEIRSDPIMDPSYESEEDMKESGKRRRGALKRSYPSSISGKRAKLVSQQRGGDISADGVNRLSYPANTSEQSRSIITAVHMGNEDASLPKKTMDESSFATREGLNNGNGATNLVNPASAMIANGSVPEDLLDLPSGDSLDDIETERLWHYQDPSGKTQGPFAMVQLRKWNSSRFFPPELKVWRTTESQNDSILLTDALKGVSKEPSLNCGSHLPSEEVEIHLDDPDDHNGPSSGSGDAVQIEITKESSLDTKKSNHATSCDGIKDGLARNDALESHSGRTATAEVVKSKQRQTENSGQEWTLKDQNSWCGQPQPCSMAVTKLPEGSPELSNQVREVLGAENNSSPSDGNQNSQITSEGRTDGRHCCEKRDDSDGNSANSSGQNWRPPVDNPAGWNSDSVIGSSAKTNESLEQHSADQPRPEANGTEGESKVQAAEVKQSPSPNAPLQDFGPSWSTTSTLVGGGGKLPDVAGEWGRYSPAPAKPPVEEWDSSLITASSLKPTEIANDHAATPASVNNQVACPSPSHLASNASSWQAIGDDDPNEFTSLVDESVSDLLAEVEAMETLSGLHSPTSIMNCGGELARGSKDDCFDSDEDFSPAAEIGKGDALSSTGDLQLRSQSPVIEERRAGTQAAIVDRQNPSGSHSSNSVDVDGRTKPCVSSANQWEASPNIPPPAGTTTAALTMAPTGISWRAGAETADTSWGSSAHGNSQVIWSHLNQGNANMGWGHCPVTTTHHGIAGMSSNTYLGNPGPWNSSQARYGGVDRSSSPRDRSFHGRDSGFGRGRSFWNNRQQPSSGGGNRGGGGPYQAPPRGQRVCKFYESGYCKRGAACSYLHP